MIAPSAYIDQGHMMQSDDEKKKKHTAINCMSAGQLKNFQTIRMFFHFIILWFVENESSLIRAESEFIRGSVKGGCGRAMTDVARDGELLIPILYVICHHALGVDVC